jgi:hypothetical protein
MNVNVEFPPATIEQLKRTTSSVRQQQMIDDNPQQELSIFVQNAIRVYMQLRQIAKDTKDTSSVTVISQGRRYTINLE